MKNKIGFAICISMLIVGWAQAADNSGRNSHFWLTIKPLAGNDTEIWDDMVLANGYRNVDLYHPDLACTRVNEESTTAFTVIWTGNSFIGDDRADVLRFDLLVNYDAKTFSMENVTIGGADLSANGLELHDFESHFSDGNLQLNFIVRNPSLLVEDPDHVYGDLPNGHTYGPTPYESMTQAKLDNAFPTFSWDRLQRTMLIRHGRAGYTDRQIERMAKSYPVIVLEKANGGFAGYRKTTRRLKEVNPDLKSIFYWNHELDFGDYGIDPLTQEEKDEFVNVRPLVRNRVRQYSRMNPRFQEWWRGSIYKMLGLEEGFAENGEPFITDNKNEVVDGTFIDRRDYPAFLYMPLYEKLPDNKLHIVNNGNDIEYRERIAFADGLYREGPAYRNIPFSLRFQQEAARKKRLTMIRSGLGHRTLREIEDRFDPVLAFYLGYVEPYSYLFYQASVDAVDEQYKWLADWVDQGLRPLGAPYSQALWDGHVITRSFEHCDLFYDLKSKSGKAVHRVLWKNNVGNPALKGDGTSHSDYTYSLQGGGNISGTGDNFFFLSDLHYGNGELKAKLSALENTHANARAGIMFRERVEPVETPLEDYADDQYVENYVAAYKDGTVIVSDARTIAVLRDPSGEMVMVCRNSRGEGLSLIGQADAAKGPYVKLVRNGDVFTGSCSVDEKTWTEIGQVALALPERVEAGMAVCSGDPDALTNATLSEFSRVESSSATQQ
ncbi:hypothetical protein Q31b_19150 [Novipirellula aureliae]|uniref:Uncharacterized protein n=1 Tax=Novipirellula aureliae TaxID=2527966 RepID=A0A5C6EB32_9BACT|nr:hypothetical protein [Novipirellula aureliae]TWU44379.1 hypothetical protein Q31b_19150 [Novipirellula aureliae]